MEWLNCMYICLTSKHLLLLHVFRDFPYFAQDCTGMICAIRSVEDNYVLKQKLVVLLCNNSKNSVTWELNFSSVLKAYSRQSLDNTSIWAGGGSGGNRLPAICQVLLSTSKHRVSWLWPFFKEILRFFQVSSLYCIYLMQSHQFKFLEIKAPYFKSTKLYFQSYAENKYSGPFISNTISHKSNVCKFMRPLSEGRADKCWKASNSAIFPLPSLTNRVFLTSLIFSLCPF